MRPANDAPILKLYYTSDVHGHFFPTSYGDREEKDMGLFQCAGQFEKDDITLVLDGGDILQGSAFTYYCQNVARSPGAIADIMNRCGYDFVTVGNHDFNYGAGYLRQYLAALNGACVCQNICDAAGTPLFPPVIRTLKSGLRVGLVGIVTDYVNLWEAPENLAGLCVTDPFAAAKEALEGIQAQCDITVCIYHGGYEREPLTGEAPAAATTENIACRICEELRFDILLTAHQHRSLPGQYLQGTYTLQLAENAKEYAALTVHKSGAGYRIQAQTRKAAGPCPLALQEAFAPVEARVQAWLDAPVGSLPLALLPESRLRMAAYGSPIADFFNQVQLHYSGAQLSAVSLANEVNGFAQRVTRRDVIASYPYANTLVVLRVSGAVLRAALERSAEYFTLDASGQAAISPAFLHPKLEHYNYDFFVGAAYKFDIQKPLGQRVTGLCVGGRPVQASDSFTLCLNSYRACGSGGYPMYEGCPRLREINIEMSELILRYFEEHPAVELMPMQKGCLL
ncbi:MAG: bifunctional metallophosphatase/5'-nucleotidase [Christensenellaceae bacterium]|jgi:2',3'-cyclic-nucleotide 2'-phosphodiesterase/3'-nucleotidase|nr:bifunctional metallophosphatase/5'-nucleotidase [Christensenellaceae bacterium]